MILAKGSAVIDIEDNLELEIINETEQSDLNVVWEIENGVDEIDNAENRDAISKDTNNSVGNGSRLLCHTEKEIHSVKKSNGEEKKSFTRRSVSINLNHNRKIVNDRVVSTREVINVNGSCNEEVICIQELGDDEEKDSRNQLLDVEEDSTYQSVEERDVMVQTIDGKKYSTARSVYEEDAMNQTIEEKDVMVQTVDEKRYSNVQSIYEEDIMDQAIEEKDVMIQTVDERRYSTAQSVYEEDAMDQTLEEKDVMVQTVDVKDAMDQTVDVKDATHQTVDVKDSMDQSVYEKKDSMDQTIYPKHSMDQSIDEKRNSAVYTVYEEDAEHQTANVKHSMKQSDDMKKNSIAESVYKKENFFKYPIDAEIPNNTLGDDKNLTFNQLVASNNKDTEMSVQTDPIKIVDEKKTKSTSTIMKEKVKKHSPRYPTLLTNFVNTKRNGMTLNNQINRNEVINHCSYHMTTSPDWAHSCYYDYNLTYFSISSHTHRFVDRRCCVAAHFE